MTKRWRAPCVTLTTDFGTADGYAGAMKGVLVSRAPGVPLVDLTHAVAPQDVAAGAFALAQAAPQFPEGTVHVAVIDPGVGGRRHPVVIRGARHLFVGPDNGLFSLVEPGACEAHAIEAAAFVREQVSATFHGRDVFAPAAAALAMGARPEDAGPRIELEGALPGAAADAVIHVDRFGNLITAIPRERVPLRAAARINDQEISVVTTYGDVEPGELLAYIGSAGTLEIAVREGSAAERLGAGRGTRVSV